MQDYIAITQFNDFIFCPYSLYLHTIYHNFNQQTYHDLPQVNGLITHEKLDKQKYSTHKSHLQNKPVYSGILQIMGKIDFFDANIGLLRERKHKIHKVYLGNKYQLYAQQFCLEEMGYTVKFLDLYSMSDNKHYVLERGSNDEYCAIYELSKQMRAWTPQTPHQSNPKKCDCCIYNTMCERAVKHDQ